ncbi:hypothetical protein WKH50_21075 [Pantoea agglomerans]|uniref:hypothetical protein n=1 Tax=Enterobacter agglomerans TaxID=549 RepID=UPI003C7B8463
MNIHDFTTSPDVIRGLPVAIVQSLKFLAEMREARMSLDERAELMMGALMSLAQEVCDTVTDWTTPRPLMPLSSWQAWALAHELVKDQGDGCGEAAWEHACNDLHTLLKFGYASFRDDIA